MQKLGTYTFHIDPYLTDFNGRATLTMVANFILQAATKHAEARGFGYNYMKSINRAWVLSRMTMEIYQYPDNEQNINVTTWIAEVNKMFTERNFSFTNDSGKIIGYARTIWANIDVNTRHAENVSELYNIVDFITENPCPIENMRKIMPFKDEPQSGKFTIRYSDVDINNHLNSVKYIEHFVDMFDIQMFKTKQIERFEIHFAAEAVYGQKIALFKKQEAENVFALEMRSDEIVISSARAYFN